MALKIYKVVSKGAGKRRWSAIIGNTVANKRLRCRGMRPFRRKYVDVFGEPLVIDRGFCFGSLEEAVEFRRNQLLPNLEIWEGAAETTRPCSTVAAISVGDITAFQRGFSYSATDAPLGTLDCTGILLSKKVS